MELHVGLIAGQFFEIVVELFADEGRDGVIIVQVGVFVEGGFDLMVIFSINWVAV